jgi:hypothetical protein
MMHRTICEFDGSIGMHALTSDVSSNDFNGRIGLAVRQVLSSLLRSRPAPAASAAAPVAPAHDRAVTVRNLAAEMNFVAWRS